MFLSGSFLGVSSFQQVQPIPVKRAYSKIKVFGNATIDKLQVRSTEIDNMTLQNRIITDTLTWTPDTLSLAEFENTLAGGNITGLIGSVTNWQVTRTNTSTSVLKILGTIDVSKTSYVDYTVQSNKQYTYDVFATNATQISEPLQTSQVDTSSIYGYFLVDPVQQIAYKFDLEITSGDIQYVEDVTIFPSYTKYPVIIQGQRKYMTTTIQVLASTIDVNGVLQQSVDYVDTLRDFILNGQSKLWKTRKGQIHSVFTHNFHSKQLNDAIGQQPLLISFDVVEVGDV